MKFRGHSTELMDLPPVPSAAERAALLRRWIGGDESVRELLWLASARLALRVAMKQYAAAQANGNRRRGCGLDFDDMAGAALSGIASAFKTYKADAAMCDKQLCARWNVYVCFYAANELRRQRNAERKIDRTLTMDSGEKLDDFWANVPAPGLERPYGPDVVRGLKAEIGRLDGRTRTIVELYTGLDPRGPITMSEIGVEFGITTQRVRQIINHAAMPRLARRMCDRFPSLAPGGFKALSAGGRRWYMKSRTDVHTDRRRVYESELTEPTVINGGKSDAHPLSAT